jgi:PilZ domain
MSRERRQHQRYSMRFAAEVNFGDRRITASTRDISVGGCAIVGAVSLPENTHVQVGIYVVVDDIEESSIPPLEVLATVQWSAETDAADPEHRYSAGLKFSGLTDEQSAWLDHVVSRVQGS